MTPEQERYRREIFDDWLRTFTDHLDRYRDDIDETKTLADVHACIDYTIDRLAPEAARMVVPPPAEATEEEIERAAIRMWKVNAGKRWGDWEHFPGMQSEYRTMARAAMHAPSEVTEAQIERMCVAYHTLGWHDLTEASRVYYRNCMRAAVAAGRPA